MPLALTSRLENLCFMMLWSKSESEAGAVVGCDDETSWEVQGSLKLVPECLVTVTLLRPHTSAGFYRVQRRSYAIVLPQELPLTPRLLDKVFYRPCRNLSASCRLPNSHAFRKPCSDNSMFTDDMSCAGGLLTREATITGSVSRMMPSSTSSSTASDYFGQQITKSLGLIVLTTRS